MVKMNGCELWCRRQVIVVLLAALIAASVSGLTMMLTANPAQAAEKFEPPDGSAYTGAFLEATDETELAYKTSWDGWTSLMGGKPAALSHTFRSFDDHRIKEHLRYAEARNSTALLSWTTGGSNPDPADDGRDDLRGALPKVIANAGVTGSGRRTDEVILRTARWSVNHKKPIFLRIDQEMDGQWMPWCAYYKDGSGQVKQRNFTPEDFKKMWKRIVIIFRGGTVQQINDKLAAQGMPPLDPTVDLNAAGLGGLWGGTAPSTSDPTAYFKPASNVAFAWTPNYLPSPKTGEAPGNDPEKYYPGDGYVDWVGQSFYNHKWTRWPDFVTPFSQEGLQNPLDAFYGKFSDPAGGHGKPYMVGEWGMWPNDPSRSDYVPGYEQDDPRFVHKVLDWAGSKPKVKAMVSFSSHDRANGVDLRLSSYPNSAAAQRSRLKNPRYLAGLTSIGSGPSGLVNSRSASFSFSSPDAGASFECSLDGAAFGACSSPKGYTSLSDGSHTFKVRGVDVSGKAEAYPTVRTFAVDATAPTVTAPKQGLVQNSTLGTANVPVALSWSGSDGGSGVDHYNLERSADGGAFSPVALPSPTATSATLQLAPGHTYRFRLRAKDKAGNAGSWAESSFYLKLHQEDSGNVVYSTTPAWYTVSGANEHLGGQFKHSASTGAKAKFTFWGKDVAWVASEYANRGYTEVWVDGVKVATVDQYAASYQPRQVVFRKSWASTGSHTLELRVLGTKRAASSGTRVEVDAFVIVQD